MSFYDEHSKPMLTEPGVKYFLNATLKQCHTFKESHHNMLFNISMLAGFLLILGVLLLYKYKGRLSREEMREKEEDKKRYILSKIRNFKQAKLRAQQELITGLPHWESELEEVNKTIIGQINRNI
jgi:hypothetical protein